jgi:hypothetical protein
MDEKEKQVLSAYLTWSESEVGIIMLRDLQETYGMQISHTAGDPCTTAFREGERAAGLIYPLRMIAKAIEVLRNPQPKEGEKDEG